MLCVQKQIKTNTWNETISFGYEYVKEQLSRNTSERVTNSGPATSSRRNVANKKNISICGKTTVNIKWPSIKAVLYE